jgi:hypothetical protein
MSARLAWAYLPAAFFIIMATATNAATATPTSATMMIALSLIRRCHRDERGNNIFARRSNIVSVQIQGEKSNNFFSRRHVIRQVPVWPMNMAAWERRRDASAPGKKRADALVCLSKA